MTDNQTSATPEDKYPKRKAPPDFDSCSKGSETTASKKPPITYAKRAKGVLDSSPGDLYRDQNLADRTSQPANQLNETNWVLEGTMREAYAQHNPNAMFPEPSSPISDDDLADLGLPKEQYKPRPSRSRSLKTGTQESIDYSVRPEKTTKANRRRKSTPASTDVANPLSTPDRIQQICDMGFTPSTSAKALKQNNGDVTQSVDWLITNRVADDELVSHTSQMSRDDTQQSIPNIDIKGYDSDLKAGQFLDSHARPMTHGTGSDTMITNVATATANDASSVVDIKSPAKVQVVIPVKLSSKAVAEMAAPKVPLKKAKRKNTTLEQSKATTVDSAVTEAKAEKKRGRGRPKKAAKAVSSTELVHEEVEGTGEQMRDTPLNSIDGNARPIAVQQQAVGDTEIAYTTKPAQAGSSAATENTRSVIATSRSTPEPRELPDRPEVEPITPERVKKPVPREQPSSNKPKVPYRVGLSKRTRIAPLLRVIKK
ncbi:chitin deacetylase [Didymella keratinophila]|nr:chitin deacetylase [Didymella keratinophila]